jgi:N-acetylmuramoyl-L-alanine amidase
MAPANAVPPTQAPAPVIVVVDAGHGGSDSGATGFGDLPEKDLTLSIARLVQFLAWGDPEVRIVLTRTIDITLPLKDRTDLANRLGAALYLSIHVNAYPRSGSINGIETLVPEGHDSRLAERDLALAKTLHGMLLDQLDEVDRGLHEQRLYLRWAQMPAALVETGFITNQAEAQKLNTLWYQVKIAKILLDGIKAYLHQSNSAGG